MENTNENKPNNNSELIKVVGVDENKCVNCHACITACPVKYCNDGSGNAVSINKDMCIACGSCIEACTHNARYFIDDFFLFLHDIDEKQKMIAIVSPAVAANFPRQYMNINGWLKSMGVEAVFDVSFGAELTVRSYIEHIRNTKPVTTIAQPCPALVSFIEVYHPELIKYLAPADSPMVHTMKMIKKFYPKYKDHKIAVLSPCNAKKREFEATGFGDYNIAYKSIDKYIRENKINLSSFPEVDFDNPPAERAVLFSSPGGLLETVKRWQPELERKTRKIEGVHLVYTYLEQYQKVLENNQAPLLVDCLSCEYGCNAGPLTVVKNKPIDEIEYWVEKRNQKLSDKYLNEASGNQSDAKKNIEETIDKYWRDNLYERKYVNRWQNNKIKYPNNEELNEIYHKMHKYTDEHLYNCSSCGYAACEKMAVAIFNGLNRPENCHFYLASENEISTIEIEKSRRFFSDIIKNAQDGFLQVDLQGTIVLTNPALQKMLKKADLIGRKISDFLDYRNKNILNNQLKLRRENKNSIYELSLTDSENQQVTCLVSGSPLYDNGKHIGSFAMITNITPLKNAQKKLEKINLELEDRVKERTAELSETLEELRTTTEVIAEKNEELQKLSIVAEGTDNVVMIMDKNGFFEWTNNAFTRIYGYTLDEFKTTFGDNILKASSNPNIKNAVNICIENKSSISYEAANQCKNGNKVYTQTTLSPILNSDGEIDKIVAIDADITQMKEAEEEILQQNEEIMAQTEALLESDQKLQNIIQFIPDAVMVIDENGVIVSWNNALEKLTGKTASEMLGKGNYEYALPFYGKRRPILIDLVTVPNDIMAEKYKMITKTGNIIRAETFVPELKGRERYLTGTAIALYDSKGKHSGAIEVIRDITEKKMAEQELKNINKKLENQAVELSEMVEELRVSQEIIEDYNQELEKLSIVASKTDNAVAILDPKGNYEWVNDSFTRLYGFTLNQFIEAKSGNILNVVTTDVARESIKEAINLKKTAIYEMPATNSNYERIWVQSTVTPIVDVDGNISRLVVIDSNIDKLKKAETEILEQKEEIAVQRDEVSTQRDIAEKQRKHLTDSITYASKIQNAMLPPDELLQNHLNKHFVIFLPKDIVSGDFYWATQKAGKTIVVAGDCTGHGVPGGFLSMLGMSFLSEIVNKQPNNDFTPAQILNQLRDMVITALHQTGKHNEAKDGMDIALCIINQKEKQLDFAGANNPLYIIREKNNPDNAIINLNDKRFSIHENKKYELVQIKGDKMPIGIHLGPKREFETKSIKYKNGDMFYIFSDGYIDQFGGDEGRKFLSKNFKQLLLKIRDKSMLEQKQQLIDNLIKWKGNKNEQVDDILVIGVEL